MNEDAELARQDGAYLAAARQYVQLWGRDVTAIVVPGKWERPFQLCFPLAAHAINLVAVGVDNVIERPFVATVMARVAFEHALAAEWVLHTEDGENQLARHMEYGLITQARGPSNSLDSPPKLSDLSARQPARATSDRGR